MDKKRGGRYVVEIYDQQGHRRKKVLPAGSLKRDAREELDRLEGQVNKGIFTPVRETLTFSQVAKKYIKHKKATIGDKFRITTWDTYTHLFSEKDWKAPLKLEKKIFGKDGVFLELFWSPRDRQIEGSATSD